MILRPEDKPDARLWRRFRNWPKITMAVRDARPAGGERRGPMDLNGRQWSLMEPNGRQ